MHGRKVKGNAVASGTTLVVRPCLAVLVCSAAVLLWRTRLRVESGHLSLQLNDSSVEGLDRGDRHAAFVEGVDHPVGPNPAATVTLARSI
jgi:hypothetical protein